MTPAISLPPDPAVSQSPPRTFSTQFRSGLWQATQLAVAIVTKAIFSLTLNDLARVVSILDRRRRIEPRLTRSKALDRRLRRLGYRSTA